MIGIVDYGAGNLRSVANALSRLQLRYTTCTRADELARCERIILPGVGHFGAAAAQLHQTEMNVALIRLAREGRPMLGICLGMQLLFESSDEAPGVTGLGLLGGRSRRLDGARVPQMGWNQLLWADQSRPAYAYFAHSYEVQPTEREWISATTAYEGRPMVAAVRRDAIVGMQFHPEKSGAYGLTLLRRFGTC